MSTDTVMAWATPSALASALSRNAAGAPRGEALRQKQRGEWRSWSWTDVDTGACRLAEVLQGHGIKPGSRVTFSAAYGPGIVLAALAALRIGATVEVMPTTLDSASLLGRLRARPVGLALLGRRQQIALWLAAQAEVGSPTVICADVQLPWSTFGSPRVLPATQLSIAAANIPLTSHPVLWAEETTDWEEGLFPLLEALSTGSHTLAFPETPRSAPRDRRDAQPHTLLLSPDALRRLQSDVQARLPATSGFTAFLVRRALSATRRGFFREQLRARIRQPLGLSRVQNVMLTGMATARNETDSALWQLLDLNPRSLSAGPNPAVGQVLEAA